MTLTLLLAPFAARADNYVVGWGDNSAGQITPPPGLSGVVAIAAGGWHSLALKRDGTVVGWGSNTYGGTYYGQATPPAGLSDVVAISAGERHSLALKSDGTVVGWGQNDNGQAAPPGISDAVAISAGGVHSLALRRNGTVVGWGYNAFGQATPPAGLSNVVAISAGGSHSLALKRDGTVVQWGGYAGGPPAGLSGVVAISAGSHYSLALKSDGTVVAWGDNYYGQTTLPMGLSGVIAISAGENHGLALKSSGTVVGWGWNPSGQAMPPAGLSRVIALSGGFFHSLALISSDTLPSTDVTPPVLTVPGDQQVAATGPSGAIVVFSATAYDDQDGSLPVSCAPGSGSLFLAGTTTVVCSAEDRSGNRASASFRITVTALSASFAFSVPGMPQCTLTLRQGDPPTLTFHLVGAGGYVRDGQTPVSTLKGCGTIQSVQVVGSQVVVHASNGTYTSRDGFIYTRAG